MAYFLSVRAPSFYPTAVLVNMCVYLCLGVTVVLPWTIASEVRAGHGVPPVEVKSLLKLGRWDIGGVR